MDAYIPEDYLCPITQELMRDPVVAADGQSYEREAITQWLNKGHKTSPLTGESLKYDVVIENHRLKAIIDAFRQNLPEIQREQQIKADLDVAIKLREEIIAHNQQTPGQDHSEALKKKDEENKALKENLLKMQRELEEMKIEMQAKQMQAPISKESVKNPLKAEPIQKPQEKPTLKKMASDADKKFQEMQAKRDVPKADVPKADAILACSICHLEIIGNLVFTNEYCRHNYCLYCVQEAGEPNEKLCYLKVCPASLDKAKLKKFTTEHK